MSPQVDLSEVAHSICSSKGLTFRQFVGGGAFKQVFQVEREENEVYALKVVAEATRRTAREIQALQLCDHPNIARLFEVDTQTHQGISYDYLLEEFLAGGTLTQKLAAEGNLNTEQTLRFGEKLIEALGHLACHKLVHRDIKPDNIMYREDGSTPVIVDFGLVRDLSAVSLTETWAGQPGTPFYAPPEQLNNQKRLIDRRTDQFSLGIVLCFARFGIHPFQQSTDSSPSVVVERVANRENRSTNTINRIRESGLDCIEKMTRIWPVERYRQSEDLIQAWREQG